MAKDLSSVSDYPEMAEEKEPLFSLGLVDEARLDKIMLSKVR